MTMTARGCPLRTATKYGFLLEKKTSRASRTVRAKMWRRCWWWGRGTWRGKR